MHLARFLERHPGSRVGRPRWTRWAVAVAAAGVGLLGGIGGALTGLSEGSPGTALIAAVVAFGCGVALPRGVARLLPLWTLTREGRKSWAVSDEAMILVDGRGAAVEVELERIVSLELDGEEPRLRIDDADQQGVIYAVLFDVFDELGPSAESFVDALEPALRARMPHAQIVRHAELPLS